MLTALVAGIILGFVLSVPPGPIGVAVIKQALDGHYKYGVWTAAGASLMDVLYTLAAAFASSALMLALSDFIGAHPIVMVFFQVVCIVVLVTLGIKYLSATTREVVESAQKEIVQERKAQRLGLSSPVLVGILIAVTNLASPTFIPSLLLFASMMRQKGYLGAAPWQSVVYSVGFGFGAWLWFLALLWTLYSHRQRLSPRFINHIYYFASGVFGVSAVVIAFHVLTTTPWATLFQGTASPR